MTIMFIYDGLMNMSSVSQQSSRSEHSQCWVDRPDGANEGGAESRKAY